MLTSSKSKGLFLVAGILIGMLVAFGIVLLDFERIKDSLVGEIKKVFPKDEGKSKTDTVTVFVERDKAGKGIESPKDYTLDDDSIAQMDSLAVDSLSLFVKKDELLYTKNIKLIALTDNGKRSGIDSSLAKAADIEPGGLPTNYTVEFWKSPINYKGYKLGRGKIALFGIFQSNDISLVSLAGNVFLKNRDLYFRLEPSEEFCTFNPVTDKNLLTQLSQ